MFTPIEIDELAGMKMRVNGLMEHANRSLDANIADFKAQWERFWDRTLPATDMQAQLDLLATTPAVDQGQDTNALTAFFEKAKRQLAFLLAERPAAFADARNEATGVLQPIGQPYKEFYWPGWYYTVDQNTGRMIVSTPCEWSDQ